MSTVRLEGISARIRTARLLTALLVLVALFLLLATSTVHAQDTTFTIFNIPAPDPGNEEFGHAVYTLPNGNFVVVDPYYDSPTASNTGAVYLYKALPARESNVPPILISRLTGSSNFDRVGYGGIVILANGNFVVSSPLWNRGDTLTVGAATWIDATAGLTGTVTSTNSLVGGSADDMIGSEGIVPLVNGNYVVLSTSWDADSAEDAGAATWGDGLRGASGEVSPANSLVGTHELDQVGMRANALTNGNYVVSSPDWSSDTLAAVGAATWGDGATGVSGPVSALNSLIGAQEFDRIAGNGVTPLQNGNYVVKSPSWQNGPIASAGAATWRNGATGTAGTVTAANSLVGSNTYDSVGANVYALVNGNYVAVASGWDNGSVEDAGAATWGNGATGISGAVSAANSLVGTQAGDGVGSGEVAILTNGNYVVNSSSWDNGAIEDAGAVTWGNGGGGTKGAVSTANSFVGTQVEDRVGGHVAIPLTNGNYVISSSLWDRGAIENAGAATWANGETGIVGSPSTGNSIVGTQALDGISREGIVVLANGNYVICSPDWDNGAVLDVGAVTWMDGEGPSTGTVSAANSMIGRRRGDMICDGELRALNNGNYLISSPRWDNGVSALAGAVTFVLGSGPITGTVTTENSLYGESDLNPMRGSRIPLANGDWILLGRAWNNGGLTESGAVTWASGIFGATGVPSDANSVFGESTGGGGSINTAFDPLIRYLVVGRPADNAISVVIWPRRVWVANVIYQP